MPENWPIDLTY